MASENSDDKEKSTNPSENATIPVFHGSANVLEGNNYARNSSIHPYDRSTLNCFYHDTRYFVIKSNNYENVMIAKHRCVWLTPSANENKLNTAFARHRNVILLFSVKESGRFSGVARLVSPSRNREDTVPWVLPASIDPRKLKNTFDIMWLNKSDLFFSNCSHLTNPWNENKEAKIARDGQELEPTLGQTLCKMFPSDAISESCAINFAKIYMPDLLPNKCITKQSPSIVMSSNSATDSKNSVDSNVAPKKDSPVKHERHLDYYLYPSDVYTSIDFNRQFIDSIINKNYDEYIEGVISLRKQMNFQALGIEKLDQFDHFDDMDVNELADEMMKYYSNTAI